MNEQNSSQSNEPIQSSINIWVIIGVVIITALLVGGGIYAWQKNEVSKINNQATQAQKIANEQAEQIASMREEIQGLQKTTIEEPSTDEQIKTPKIIETKTDEKTPEIKENTSSLPAGVEWLTYSDDDISFVYPKTFLGTPLQEPLDENNGRTEWKVSRQKNTIYIRPTFESPAAEFGSTYEIEIIDNHKDAEYLHKSTENGTTPKNLCIASKDIQIPGYSLCVFEKEVNEGLGRVGKYYAVMPELKNGVQTPPWLYIFDASGGMYTNYISSTLLSSLKIK